MSRPKIADGFLRRKNRRPVVRRRGDRGSVASGFSRRKDGKSQVYEAQNDCRSQIAKCFAVTRFKLQFLNKARCDGAVATATLWIVTWKEANCDCEGVAGKWNAGGGTCARVGSRNAMMSKCEMQEGKENWQPLTDWGRNAPGEKAENYRLLGASLAKMRRSGQEKLGRDLKLGGWCGRGGGGLGATSQKKIGPFSRFCWSSARLVMPAVQLGFLEMWLADVVGGGERRANFLYRDRSVWKARG